MENRNILILVLSSVLVVLGYTYHTQNKTVRAEKKEQNAAPHPYNIKSIKTNSYPKLDRKMFKAEQAIRDTVQDHQTGLHVMNISDTYIRDNQIKKVANTKSREWYGDSIAPFCNYVGRINKNSRKLRKAKKQIGAYIDDPLVDKLVGDIDILENDLRDLRNAVTEHDRYVKEKEAQALRDQIALAGFAASTVTWRF